MKISHTLSAQGILEIAIDNPDKRNSLDDEMIKYLIRHLSQGQRLTIIGSKGKYFCSGRDISDIEPTNPYVMHPLRDLALAVRKATHPVIAVVQGDAIGLGVSMACWADICIASRDAAFSIPESRIGIAPTITADSLVEVVGRKRCLDMCMTGRKITAEEALEYGIAQYVVDAAELDDARIKIVNEVLKSAPEAISISKALINHRTETTFTHGLEGACQQAMIAVGTATAKEGLEAFRSKRRPSWVPEGVK